MASNTTMSPGAHDGAESSISKNLSDENLQHKTTRLIARPTTAHLKDDDETAKANTERRAGATTGMKATKQGVQTPHMTPSQ